VLIEKGKDANVAESLEIPETEFFPAKNRTTFQSPRFYAAVVGCCEQGDQIEQIFSYWTIVYLGTLF
jgi:hypothetical protein